LVDPKPPFPPRIVVSSTGSGNWIDECQGNVDLTVTNIVEKGINLYNKGEQILGFSEKRNQLYE